VLNLIRLSAYLLILSLLLFFSVAIKTPSLAATTVKQLPGNLISPQQGVICNEKAKVCYDNQGISVGITKEIMGQEAADQLSNNLSAVDKKSIAITLGSSTMMACGPKSLDQQFLKDLEGAAIWFLQKGYLHLDIKFDPGTMNFYRLLE